MANCRVAGEVRAAGGEAGGGGCLCDSGKEQEVNVSPRSGNHRVFVRNKIFTGVYK